MNVLIIENEKPAVDGLVRLLKNIDTNINVVGVTESVESTINWFQGNPNPDLIFMDIQLDDGLCFELFETIRIQIPVISPLPTMNICFLPSRSTVWITC